MPKENYIPSEPIGWPLLQTPEKGSLKYPTLEESVRQAIRIILLTRPGEQLMRPEFGVGLDNFLHEPNTLVTRKRIHDRIKKGLGLWEHRILLDRIDVWENKDEPDTVRIEIAYRLKRTGKSTTMVLNMKLGG